MSTFDSEQIALLLRSGAERDSDSYFYTYFYTKRRCTIPIKLSSK